eukprot:TRINITY_DN2738_c0_g1_i9.p2 TRINITY_DN2738_c0_g1~~TRINITY_DN2738_c0_g1_i9.p2  ORF type:complete len:350 (+),score=135.94 TRINITY_DN2738_c0_g1_i9:65-1114(+)
MCIRDRSTWGFFQLIIQSSSSSEQNSANHKMETQPKPEDKKVRWEELEDEEDEGDQTNAPAGQGSQVAQGQAKPRQLPKHKPTVDREKRYNVPKSIVSESKNVGILSLTFNKSVFETRKPIFDLEKSIYQSIPNRFLSCLQKNVFECAALDGGDDDYEDEPKEKKKDAGMKGLLLNAAAPAKKEDTKAPVLSKKEQKKKELEDLDKILNELGMAPKGEETKPKEEEHSDVKQGGAEGDEKKKKKKKKTKTEGGEATVEAKDSTEAKPEEKKETATETKPANGGTQSVVDVEQAVKAAMKKRLEEEKKKKEAGKNINLDAAKQEILNRQAAKKKGKSKKEYEEAYQRRSP